MISVFFCLTSLFMSLISGISKKKDTNELNYKTEIDSQIQKKKQPVVTKGEGKGRNNLGVCN